MNTYELSLIRDEWPYPEEYSEHKVIHELLDEVALLRAEVHSYDRLLMKQGNLLTGVVNAVRGEPDHLSAHSHHDAVELVQEVVEERDHLNHVVESVKKKLNEPSDDRGITWWRWIDDGLGGTLYDDLRKILEVD